MSPEQFVYWLQGYMEVGYESHYAGLSPGQLQVIKDHLDLVFQKVTPDRTLILDKFGFHEEVGYSKEPAKEVGYKKEPTYCYNTEMELLRKSAALNWELDQIQKYGPNHKTDWGFQKLFTGHSGVTAAGLC